jgi:hypothetical protein
MPHLDTQRLNSRETNVLSQRILTAKQHSDNDKGIKSRKATQKNTNNDTNVGFMFDILEINLQEDARPFM